MIVAHALNLVAFLLIIFALRPAVIDRWYARCRGKPLALPSHLSLIGYKQAYLSLGKKPFAGVMGTAYGFEAEVEKHTPGFHSFYTVQEAQKHEQKGTVLLEVKNEGKVRHHAKGTIATRQTVLQVIIAHCSFCSQEQAVGWLHFAQAKPLQACKFTCAGCAPLFTQVLPFTALEQKLQAYTSLPVVVATVKATAQAGAFVPSVMKRS